MSATRRGFAYLSATGLVVGGLIGFVIGPAVGRNPLASNLGAGFGLVVGAGAPALSPTRS